MKVIDALVVLSGCWKGRGQGGYPTIASFEFVEETSFTFAPEYPMVRYEQRTYLLPDRKPSHWELGFIRPTEGEWVELSNAQDGGRIEVLRGRARLLASGGVRFALKSRCLENDSRLLATERIITVVGDALHYDKYMTTTTTTKPSRRKHLEADLRREASLTR